MVGEALLFPDAACEDTGADGADVGTVHDGDSAKQRHSAQLMQQHKARQYNTQRNKKAVVTSTLSPGFLNMKPETFSYSTTWS